MSKDKKPGVPTVKTTPKMYALKLGIGERIQFGNILPVKGSLSELEMAEDILKRVTISKKMFKDHGISEVKDGPMKGNLSWDDISEKSFKFIRAEVKLMQSTIKGLSDNGEVRANMLPLVRKVNKINTEPEKK